MKTEKTGAAQFDMSALNLPLALAVESITEVKNFLLEPLNSLKDSPKTSSFLVEISANDFFSEFGITAAITNFGELE